MSVLSSLRPSHRFAILGLAFALAFAFAAGCGGTGENKKVSLTSLIPPKEAVVIIDETEKISGAWLRNAAVSQELLVRAQIRGLPMEIDEYSLIRSTRELLTKMYVAAIEGRRRGLSVTEQEVSDRLATEISNFESTEAWRTRLEGSGLTEAERRAQLEIEMLFEKYRDEVVRPRVLTEIATDDNARKFYEMHPDLWDVPMRVHLFHLHRTVARDAPESERARERAKIDEALARIRGGEAFEDVAREISTDASALRGGDMGWVTELQEGITPELRDASFALAKGEVSDVIESGAGYHIFYAREREERRKRTFEEVTQEIKDRFAQEALTRELEKEIAQLRKQMDIKYLDLRPFIGEPPAPQAPGVAPAGTNATPPAGDQPASAGE